MSKVIPSSSVPPVRYYTYVAASMVKCLDRVLLEKKITPRLFQQNLLSGFSAFFVSLGEYLNGGVSSNPPGSAANYRMAVKILEKLSRFTSGKYEARDVLEKFCFFFLTLADARTLTPLEIQVAEIMRDFFAQMRADGESEHYVRAVGDSADDDD